MDFAPNYEYFADVVKNKRPARLPLYEHHISAKTMERILGTSFADMYRGDNSDLAEFFRNYCRFFKEMTYDVVSFEVCIGPVMPDSGALSGGKAGPIN